jgi:REP element-mobilizing transposase RayT
MEERRADASVGDHRPLHWYVDRGCYWITAATLYHHPYFRTATRKRMFVDELLHAADAWSVQVVAWTLLDIIIHAILYPQEGRALSRFLGRLHGRTAIKLNQEEGMPGRQVWCQYWDSICAPRVISGVGSTICGGTR